MRPDSKPNERSTLETAAKQGDKQTILRWVTSFPQAARELAMNEFLANWGEDWKAGKRHRAMMSLHMAHEIGEALREIGGDRTVADAVSTIEQSWKSLRITGKLARAHAAYGSAMRHFLELSVETSAAQFREARAEFSLSGSLMTMWADCGLGGVEISRHHYKTALSSFKGLIKKVDQHRYPAPSMVVSLGASGWLVWTPGSI